MKENRTRRGRFLEELERIVPRGRLEAVIAPSCPCSGRVGGLPIGLPKMLRMYCLQQRYGLANLVIAKRAMMKPEGRGAP